MSFQPGKGVTQGEYSVMIYASSKLLCVDPGTRGNMGAARFWGGSLIDWCEGKPQDIVSHIQSAELIAFEMPEIYRSRDSKGDPNRLKGLIKQIGWVQGVAFALNPTCQFLELLPKQWKGNIDKRVHHRRCLQLITPNDCQPPPLAKDNAWDAIALGLYLTRRYTANTVFRSKQR